MSHPHDDLRALLDEGRQLADHESSGVSEETWEESSRRDGGSRSIPWDGDPEPAVGRGRLGRPTPTLQATWIDPEETPFLPAPRPGKAVPARLFSLMVTAAIVGLLAWLILPEVSFRLGNADTVTVPRGVLTAQPVPLAPTRPAIVEELFVDAGKLPDGALPAGTPIARLQGATPDAFGNSTIDLSVPFDARFVSVDTLAGAVTMPGTPVATVYDPMHMYVIATVTPDTLDSLRRGMRARLTSPLLAESIEGTLVAAIPALGTEQEPTSRELVNVRIQPDEGTVRDLVPGIRFEAAIDLRSAPEGAQPLVFTAPDDGAQGGGG